MSVASLESSAVGYSIDAYLRSLTVQNQITQGDGNAPVVLSPGVNVVGNLSTSGAGSLLISNNLSTPQIFSFVNSAQTGGGFQQNCLDIYAQNSTTTQVARIQPDGTLNYFRPATFSGTLAGLAKTSVLGGGAIALNLDVLGNNVIYTCNTAGAVITLVNGISAKGQSFTFVNTVATGNVQIVVPGQDTFTINATNGRTCLVLSIDNGSGGTRLWGQTMAAVS